MKYEKLDTSWAQTKAKGILDQLVESKDKP